MVNRSSKDVGAIPCNRPPRASLEKRSQYIMGFRSRRSRAAGASAPREAHKPASGVIMTARWWLGAAFALMIAFSSCGVASSAPLANFETALAQLAKDLADQSLPAAQRLEVVRVLAGWATPEARAPLLAARKDPAPEIRASAALALGWPGNREATAALRALAESPEEPAVVKAGALEALGIIGDPSTRTLLAGATRHADARVRQAALRSLALGPLADPA